MRAAWLCAVLGLWVAPGVARADLTVIYPPAAPAQPLTATVVCAAELRAQEASADPSAPVEPASSPALPPITPELSPTEMAPAPEEEASTASASSTAVVESEPVESEAAREEPAVATEEVIEIPVELEAPIEFVFNLEAPTLPERERADDEDVCPGRLPVVLERITDGSHERAELMLTDCEGTPLASDLVALALIARPRALRARPSERELAEFAANPDWVAAGIHRIHPGIAERLRAIADRFPGHVLEIISGFRPNAREGSRHLHGRAIDVRVRDVELETTHAFVNRFASSGVGLYPTSRFLHVDVRERAHRWVDLSGPGEPPRYVAGRAAPVPQSYASVASDVASEIESGLSGLTLAPPRTLR